MHLSVPTFVFSLIWCDPYPHFRGCWATFVNNIFRLEAFLTMKRLILAFFGHFRGLKCFGASSKLDHDLVLASEILPTDFGVVWRRFEQVLATLTTNDKCQEEEEEEEEEEEGRLPLYDLGFAAGKKKLIVHFLMPQVILPLCTPCQPLFKCRVLIRRFGIKKDSLQYIIESRHSFAFFWEWWKSVRGEARLKIYTNPPRAIASYSR